VHGSIAALLGEAGINFNKFLSLWQLPALTAQKGGFNYIMAATFVLFIFVGPILRCLSLIALITIPMKLGTARSIFMVSRRIVSFSAIEVMLIATPLIGQAFGPISAAAIDPLSFPECVWLGEIFGYEPHDCLRIDVNPRLGYWFNIGAVAMMVLSGYDGSPTSKYIHRRLYPNDQDPPPSCNREVCCTSQEECSGQLAGCRDMLHFR